LRRDEADEVIIATHGGLEFGAERVVSLRPFGGRVSQILETIKKNKVIE